jgi:hypothetical protein
MRVVKSYLTGGKGLGMARNSAQRHVRIVDQVLSHQRSSTLAPPGGWTNHEWRDQMADAAYDSFRVLWTAGVHMVWTRVSASHIMDDLTAKDAALRTSDD